MFCPNCKKEIGPKKYAIFNCICGKTLMLIEINKIKQIIDVTQDKEGEIKC